MRNLTQPPGCLPMNVAVKCLLPGLHATLVTASLLIALFQTVLSTFLGRAGAGVCLPKLTCGFAESQLLQVPGHLA